MKLTKYGHPRRSDIETMTPTELAILNAMRELEKLPAHPRLTDALMLLLKALDTVSDFEDGLIK